MKCHRFLLQVTTPHCTYLPKVNDSGRCLAGCFLDYFGRNAGRFMGEMLSLLLLEGPVADKGILSPQRCS